MDEWVKMENLDLTTVDISDSEGSDGKGCGGLLHALSMLCWASPVRAAGRVCRHHILQAACQLRSCRAGHACRQLGSSPLRFYKFRAMQ